MARRVLGLIVAAILAPAITFDLFGIFTLLLWPERGLLSWNDLLLGPLVAVTFGGVGAAIFLSIALTIARRLSPRRRTYVWAGVLAGLAHSGCGVIFDLIQRAAEHPQASESLNSALSHIEVIAGFMLVEIAGHYEIWATPVLAAAAALAGAVSGTVYAWIAVTRRDSGTISKLTN